MRKREKQCSDIEAQYGRLRETVHQPGLGHLTSDVKVLVQGLVQEHIETHPLVKQVLQERTSNLTRALATPTPSTSDDAPTHDLHLSPMTVPGLSSSTTGATLSSLSSTSTEARSTLSSDGVAVIATDRRSQCPGEGRSIKSFPIALPGHPHLSAYSVRQQPANEDSTVEFVIHSPSEEIVKEVRRTRRRGDRPHHNPPSVPKGDSSQRPDDHEDR